MSASLIPGSCCILLGLVSMATGSQQAARQLEGSRQARQTGREAWAARGRLKLWGLAKSPGKIEGTPGASSKAPPLSSEHLEV